MVRIDSIEGYLRLFEGPEWSKTSIGEGYDCRLGDEAGHGNIRVFGNVESVCYLEMDFCYSSDMAFFFSVEEPYVEISVNLDAADSKSPDGRRLKVERGANCHVNLGDRKALRVFPSGTRFRKGSLVIRERFLRERIPGFLGERMADTATGARPGRTADPRIAVLAKQLGHFPLHAPFGTIYLEAKALEAVALLQDGAARAWPSKPKEEVEHLRSAVMFAKMNYREDLRIQDICERFNLNRNKLQEGFLLLTGLTVHELVLSVRVQEASFMLADSDAPIPEVARRVGFGSAKSLYDAFAKFLGTPPGQVRKALKGSSRMSS